VVKIDSTVNIDGVLPDGALHVLREVPGIIVTERQRRPARDVDALVRHAGTKTGIALDFKRQVNAATAWRLVHESRQHPDVPLLLVAHQTTKQAREILREHGVGVVDGQGNAHVELPGLVYHLSGQSRRLKREPELDRPARLSGKAALVAQALMLQPDHEWNVRSLAERAQASVGLVHRILVRLERERIVESRGAGPRRVRRLADPTALLDLWAEENHDRVIKSPAYMLAQTSGRLLSQVADRLAAGGLEYAITGSAAASLVAPQVTSVPVVEVWVEHAADAEHLRTLTRARDVDEGHNLVFLQSPKNLPMAFRDPRDGISLVNRFRLYVDLRNDPRRGAEQADYLRREVIGF